MLYVSTTQNLAELAKEIRENRQSEVDAWMTRQSEWGDTGIDLNELCRPAFPSGPRVLDAASRISVTMGKENGALSFTRKLFDFLLELDNSSSKKALTRILVFYATCRGTWEELEPSDVISNVLPNRANWASLDIIVTPNSADKKWTSWVKFYDRYGRSPDLRCALGNWRLEDAPIEELWQEFQKDTSLLGVLKLVSFWVSGGTKIEVSPRVLAELRIIGDPEFRIPAILIQLSQKNLRLDEAERIAASLASVVENNPATTRMLIDAITNHAKDTPALETVLKQLDVSLSISNSDLRARVESLRYRFLRARPSGFDIQRLNKLGLPFIET